MVRSDQKGGFDMDAKTKYEQALKSTLTLFDEAGLDPATFDQRSVKTFHDLVMEVARDEVVLVKLSEQELREKTNRKEVDFTASDNLGGIKRIAWSSKLIIRTETEYLVEMFRLYPGRNTPVHKRSCFSGVMLDQPNWTLSETAVKSEDPLEVILRGLREELGFVLSSRHVLTCLNPGGFYQDSHESSVYDQTVTENYTTWYEWVWQGRKEDTVVRRDDQVELHLKWQRMDFAFPEQE